MKHTIHYIVLLLALLSAVSCKKTEDIARQTSSLTIVNCTSDGTVLFSEFYGGKTSFANRNLGIQPPAVGNFVFHLLEKGLSSGSVPFKLYAFPDSVRPVITDTKNLQPSGIYSLFVSGTKSSLDTFFVAERVPSAPEADSVVFVRIVNLDKQSGPLSINLAGKSPLPSMTNLNYRNISPYETISVRKKDIDGDYLNLELRSAAGTLLDTFTYRWRFTDTPNSQTHNLSRQVTVALIRLGTETKSIVINPVLFN